MPKNLIDEVVSASPNRRSFMKTIAAATAGVGALSMAGLTPAQAQTTTEIEVLKFALNLEYLESEFYTYAFYGRGIETFGIGVNGEANGSNPAEGGTTTGGKMVGFNNAAQVLSAQVAAEIGSDERAHVRLLRSALGSQTIAKPNLNLNALGFGFDSQDGFLRLSRIFEDIGVSAYAGRPAYSARRASSPPLHESLLLRLSTFPRSARRWRFWASRRLSWMEPISFRLRVVLSSRYCPSTPAMVCPQPERRDRFSTLHSAIRLTLRVEDFSLQV